MCYIINIKKFFKTKIDNAKYSYLNKKVHLYAKFVNYGVIMKNQEQQLKEEQAWLNSVKRKLFKLISSPYWDCIHISDLQLSIVTHINNTTDVRNLSPVINERVTDMLIQDLTNKIKNAKVQSKHN